MRRKEKFFGTPLAVARGASGWHAEEPALQFSCLRWWGLGRAGQWRNTIWLCSLSSQLLQLCGHEGCQDVFLALTNHETPHITPFPVRKAPEQLRSSGCALKPSWLHGDLISKSYLKKSYSWFAEQRPSWSSPEKGESTSQKCISKSGHQQCQTVG